MIIFYYAICDQVEEEMNADDAYANEPHRNPKLKVLTATPFNAETPIDIIEAEDVTPVEMHFKRHHLPVPLVEVSASIRTKRIHA